MYGVFNARAAESRKRICTVLQSEKQQAGPFFLLAGASLSPWINPNPHFCPPGRLTPVGNDHGIVHGPILTSVCTRLRTIAIGAADQAATIYCVRVWLS